MVVVVVARSAGCPQVAPRPDLGLVDALARLQVAAGRLGCSVRLREVSADLAQLLDLVGFGCCGGPALALEAGGEPERGKQLGVQEVVPPDDLPV